MKEGRKPSIVVLFLARQSLDFYFSLINDQRVSVVKTSGSTLVIKRKKYRTVQIYDYLSFLKP